ncbi:MAG TPA: potassium-transporting ATPase subunit KdpC [Candidatus Angelobacter sp.]|nr:potassium-transporting ATPase subunit KdpC [Candidatus Angelobacter sp.]
MKKNLITAILYTIATTLILGLIYPAVVFGLAHLWPNQANGQLVTKNGVVVGSRILAQPFTGAAYFHPRPSAAGPNGYAADNSAGSNLGPTNHKLVDRIKSDVATLQAENPGKPVPVDLVTTSGSGLDPHITPAGAEFQVSRVAKARGIDQGALLKVVQEYTEGRQFGFLGEPRVNVLELNLALDAQFPVHGLGDGK